MRRLFRQQQAVRMALQSCSWITLARSSVCCNEAMSFSLHDVQRNYSWFHVSVSVQNLNLQQKFTTTFQINWSSISSLQRPYIVWISECWNCFKTSRLTTDMLAPLSRSQKDLPGPMPFSIISHGFDTMCPSVSKHSVIDSRAFSTPCVPRALGSFFSSIGSSSQSQSTPSCTNGSNQNDMLQTSMQASSSQQQASNVHAPRSPQSSHMSKKSACHESWIQTTTRQITVQTSVKTSEWSSTYKPSSSSKCQTCKVHKANMAPRDKKPKHSKQSTSCFCWLSGSALASSATGWSSPTFRVPPSATVIDHRKHFSFLSARLPSTFAWHLS